MHRTSRVIGAEPQKKPKNAFAAVEVDDLPPPGPVCALVCSVTYQAHEGVTTTELGTHHNLGLITGARLACVFDISS